MIDVVLTPADVARVESRLPGAQVVVLDVLRATSTITAALNAGVREIRLFDSLDAARAARAAWAPDAGPVLLAGEHACLKPDDFDLGNSPREQLTHKVANATLLLATTNGTRAAVRVRAARHLYAASLLNAAATAQALLPRLDVLDTFLVCAGTGGNVAFEDVLGAGAILFAILQSTYRTDLLFSDSAWLAYHAFAAVRQRLPAALRLGGGGVNVIDAGLEDDIDFAARLDALPLIAAIEPQTLHIRRVPQ